MIKTTVISGALAASLLVPLSAFAQERAPGPAPLTRQERLDALEIQREARLRQVGDRIASTTVRIQERIENASTSGALAPMAPLRLAERKAILQQRVQAFREDVQRQIDEFSANREANRDELKKRLSVIKDTKRQAVVLRIDDNLVALNTKILERYTESLNKMQEVLMGINVREEELRAQGIDIVDVDTATQKAVADIAAARTAITNQTGKSYPMNISSDATLGQEVKRARDAMHADIEVVRATIITVAQSIREVNAAVVAAGASVAQ